jgi:hypothetical protein
LFILRIKIALFDNFGVFTVGEVIDDKASPADISFDLRCSPSGCMERIFCSYGLKGLYVCFGMFIAATLNDFYII